jgi:hypothetical protein
MGKHHQIVPLGVERQGRTCRPLGHQGRNLAPSHFVRNEPMEAGHKDKCPGE